MKIKNILVSQPRPETEKSQYYDLIKKYNLNIHFKKFFRIDRVSTKEFRRSKINILDYNAIIFTSKNAIDNFFSLVTDLRMDVPSYMKYFFVKEEIALYIQKYAQFRKRKIFFPKSTNPCEIYEHILKNQGDKFLISGSDIPNQEVVSFLDENKIFYTKAVIYKNVSEKLTEFEINAFDLICMYSPNGVKSFAQNFPNFNEEKTKEIVFAGYGQNTCQAFREYNIPLTIEAPSPTATSMPLALEEFLLKKTRRRK